GPRVGPAEIRLLPVRRRAARLHRQDVRPDRGSAGPGRPGPAFSPPAGRRSRSGTRHDIRAAAEGRRQPHRAEAVLRRWAVDDKRQRILEAARKRFCYYGFRKTTMQEIARDARVAVGTLYLYVKDKDDLLVAGTEEYVTRHRQQAEAILASDASAADKLRRYVLDRFRASEATRAGEFSQAAELVREVLRVRPERRIAEGRTMAAYVTR